MLGTGEDWRKTSGQVRGREMREDCNGLAAVRNLKELDISLNDAETTDSDQKGLRRGAMKGWVSPPQPR